MAYYGDPKRDREFADKVIAAKDAGSKLTDFAASLGVGDRAVLFRVSRVARKLPELSDKLLRPWGGGAGAWSGATGTESDTERQIKALKVENKQLRQESADAAAIKQAIHDLKARTVTPPDWLTRERPSGGKEWHHGTPTLMLSDLHWGERVFPAQINGVNQYSLATARERLRRVVDTTKLLLFDVLSRPSYEGIVVPLGGDMVSGNIHEELRETNELPILDCVHDLFEHLVATIDSLLAEFRQVFVPCVVGNHGRLDHKPRAKGATHDNFEWLLYQFLARHYARDDRVTVLVSDALDCVYRIYGRRYLLTHGDQFRGGSGTAGPLVPWAMGDSRKRKRQQAISQPYDTMIFGHWHSLTWGPGDAWIANGSLKGYDEYAFRSNFAFEPPQQAMWVTHPKYGITFRMGVQADDPRATVKTSWVAVQKAA